MQRVAALRDEVNKSDQAVEDYRRTPARAVQERQRQPDETAAVRLNSQLLAAQTAKAEAEARLAEAHALRRGASDAHSGPEVLRSPLIAALKSQLADAERRAADLAATYGERHPQLRGIRAEAGALRAASQPRRPRSSTGSPAIPAPRRRTMPAWRSSSKP